MVLLVSGRLIGVVDLIKLAAGVLGGFWDCDPGNENTKFYGKCAYLWEFKLCHSEQRISRNDTIIISSV